MGSSNKPATTTTSQQKNPWSPVQGQLIEIAGKTQNLANDPSAWAPTYSNATQNGIDQLQAAGASPTAGFGALNNVVTGSGTGFNQGLGQLGAVAGGDYLNANQHLQPVLDQIARNTATNVNAQFSGAGRYGSGAHTQTLARNIGEQQQKALLDNYQTERGNQDRAAAQLLTGGFQGAGMAGNLDQAQLRQAMINLQAGGLIDQQEAAKRAAPINAINWQNSIVSPMGQAYGSQTGTSQTVQPVNKWTQGLGIAQMGLGLLAAPMTGGTSLLGAMGGLGSLMGGGGVSNDPGGTYWGYE